MARTSLLLMGLTVVWVVATATLSSGLAGTSTVPGAPASDPASALPVGPLPWANGDGRQQASPWPAQPSNDAALRDASYDVVFTCDSEDDTAVSSIRPVCPVYVLDQHDAMGQPILLSDPDRPQEYAFSALHGSHGVHGVTDSEAPTSRSRDNSVHQPHTTFKSTDTGRTWQDMPYHAPEGLGGDGQQVFGEDNAAVLDSEGNVVLASLYAVRDMDATLAASSPPRYAIGLWKSGSVASEIDYHNNVVVHHLNATGDQAAAQIHAVNLPDLGRTVVLWRERPATEPAPGAAPSPADPGNDSFVRLLFTDDDAAAVWTPLEADPPIGPCRAISDPVVFDREVWIGCQPGNGTAPSANQTGLQLYAIDAANGTSRHVTSTGVPGDHVRLIRRGDAGHLVALSAYLEDEPRLYVAYGDPLGRWTDLRNHAADVTTEDPSIAVVDARVTAAAYRPDSGTIHLIYMERFQAATGVQAADGQAQFRKALVAIHGEGPVQVVRDLEVGQLSRADLSATSNSAGLDAFDDLHDSILVWVSDDGREVIETVAYGDHGFVRFGRVEERDPPIAVALTSPQIPPVPLAVAGANPAVYGAGAGILAAAMVLRFLAARNKAAMEVDVKA